jgi:hypothetical protein
MDGFFKTAIAHIEVGAQAFRIGKALGLTGGALEKHIRNEVDNYGSTAWVRAADKAKELTFQDESTASRIASIVPQGAGALAKRWEGQALSQAKQGNMTSARRFASAAKWAGFVQGVMRFIFPFIRTPVNIFRMGLRKTPLGSFVLGYQLAKGFYGMATGKGFFNKYPAALLSKHITEQALATTTRSHGCSLVAVLTRAPREPVTPTLRKGSTAAPTCLSVRPTGASPPASHSGAWNRSPPHSAS